jgi:hypothetical protein
MDRDGAADPTGRRHPPGQCCHPFGGRTVMRSRRPPPWTWGFRSATRKRFLWK